MMVWPCVSWPVITAHVVSSRAFQHVHCLFGLSWPMMATLRKKAWYQDVSDLVAHDLNAPRHEYLFAVPRVLRKPLLKLLRDPRDEPLLYLLINVLLLAALPSACLFVFDCRSHLIGLVYLVANYTLFLQRFMLTLHFSEHKRLFKPEFGALNQITPHLLCTLYGVPTGLYRLHHCIMHHVEGNSSPLDLSSTEPFQRDSLLHFLQYWVKFWLGSWTQLPQYAYKKGRVRVLATSLTTELLYLGAARLLWRLNSCATLWVFVLPFFVSSLALTLGNWSQHIFVDPQHPGDPFRSTYNCIAAADNQRTYNDGYHILHHLNSQLHWAELPQQFLALLAQHEQHDALVFKHIHFLEVGLAVFSGRLEWLADHIVPCGPLQAARSKEEWVAVMRQRLQPVRRPAAACKQ